MISLIWAMDENRLIGVENRLPWRLPADMKWFRRHTLGKPIIMGRKTFDSFGGRPLPERTNIVVTRDPDYRAEGAVVVHSIDEALRAAAGADEVMIIGGASFYQQLLPRADRLYITQVHGKFEGDAWFPAFDMKVWQETAREEQPVDEKNAYACTFLSFERKPNSTITG
ncbi:MAG: type 3 dihydrofolate reductase [Gammaproteobacteria bacterium]|nr:type 3 dihydrofolate reductase [Gammaproteobacteria bacterium]